MLDWLDESGLTFYFLQKIRDLDAIAQLPRPVSSRLDRSFAANQLRAQEMSGRFELLNRKFHEVGVHYVVLKGFSLIPEFCPDAPLRYQADLDFLVDERSLTAANATLLELGYRAKASPSSREFIYLMGTRRPSRTEEQYGTGAPHAIELHLDVWDSSLHGVPLPNLFSIERAKCRHWNGVVFPALADEDAFLLQVTHAFHHVFFQKIRMSWLLEIAYFLARRYSDTELWRRIQQRVGDSMVLREFVVVMTELVAQLFSAPVPPIVASWGASIRSGPRVWIEHYARKWAFSDYRAREFSLFPRSKLALFLLQQYQDQALKPKTATVTSSRMDRISRSIKEDASGIFRASWWTSQLPLQRVIYHSLASLRYVCEIPRWTWLNRVQMRSTLLEAAGAPRIPSGILQSFDNLETKAGPRIDSF